MYIVRDYVLKEIDGQNIVLPKNNVNPDFNGLIILDEVEAFLWDKLLDERTEEELLQCILEEYEVDEETAKEDICEFIERLREGGVLAYKEAEDF